MKTAKKLLLLLFVLSLQTTLVFSDTVGPTVTVTYTPLEIGSLTLVLFTATATDPDGISNVNIFLDGSSASVCTSSTCTFLGGPYAAGSTHTYYATSTDSLGNVGTSTGTGTGTGPPPPSGPVDNMVKSLDVIGALTEGREVTIDAVVKNIGTGFISGTFAGDFMIDYNNDNPACWGFSNNCNAYIGDALSIIPSLRPGESTTVSEKWNATCFGFLPPCTHLIRFRADPMRIISPPAFPNGDTNYANNYLTRLITVNPIPNVPGSEIDVTPGTCTVGFGQACPATIDWSAEGYPAAGVRAWESIQRWEAGICPAGQFICNLNFAPGNYVLKVFENANDPASRLLAQTTLVVTQTGVVISPPPSTTDVETYTRSAKFVNWILPSTMGTGSTRTVSITFNNCQPWAPRNSCSYAPTFPWDPTHWRSITTTISTDTAQLPATDFHVVSENEIYSFKWELTSLVTPGGFAYEDYVSSLIQWDGSRWNTIPMTSGGFTLLRLGGKIQYKSPSEIYVFGGYRETVQVTSCNPYGWWWWPCYSSTSYVYSNGITRWNGGSWSKVFVNTTDTIADFHVVSDNDIYVIAAPVATTSYTLKHWDGSSLTNVSDRILSSTAGIEFVAPNAIYAVTAPAAGPISKWNGISWSTITATDFNVNYFDFIAETDIYASGFGRVNSTTYDGIAHWNGVRWEPVDTSISLSYGLQYTNGQLYVLRNGIETNMKYYYLTPVYPFWNISAVDLPYSAGSGGYVTFVFNITAPSTPGNYAFWWKMYGDKDFSNSAGQFDEPTPFALIVVKPAI